MDNVLLGQCIALLSDIHSNYHALHACVEDAKAQGADCFVFLGDYITGLADPIKTMDLVYQLQEQYSTAFVRGNRERSMLEHHTGVSVLKPGSYTGSYLFTYQQLREKDLAFFSALNIATTVQVGGIDLAIAHATMENDRYLFEKEDDRIGDVFDTMSTPYLLTGHAHEQYCCTRGNKTIINPGSVGLPHGNDWRAQYTLLRLENGQLSWDFRRVTYDMEATIHAQFQSGLAECGKYWAICDLYSAIEGKEYTKDLLIKLYRRAADSADAFYDEALWHQYAVELNLGFTAQDALNRFYETR
ncbi:MAG: metallophosphoesterase family protein [Oscillospiraceae bacterium]|nr:metallophosphoesterase family protein [Oscillospiraceae bacterium]